MILTALMELAQREELILNPHYEEKRIDYVLTLDARGRCLGSPQAVSEPAEGKKKAAKKLSPIPRPLPRARRQGTQIDPTFLVDNVSFVLGINAPGDKSRKNYTDEELTKRQQAFRDLIVAAEEATEDQGIRAVRLFLDDLLAKRQVVVVPENLKSNDVFAFLFAPDVDHLVHERPAIVAYWSKHRGTQEQAPADAAAHFQCLISGEQCVPSPKHPLLKVPGGTSSGIALVSFNEEASRSFGFVAKELRHLNAPVSQFAADAYTTALKRLLDDSYPHPRDRTPLPRRNIRLSNDTVVVFWSREESSAIDLFTESVREANPEAVAALYGSPWKGRSVRLDDPSAFYALTLSGGEGRATVRGWFESTVGDVLHNIRQHFDDLQIVRSAREEDKPFPLWQLLCRTAIQGKSENIHPSLAASMFEAILKGWPYPRTLLDAAIRRTRAERTLFSDRAALIKAYLVRAKRLRQLDAIDPNFPEVQPMLDRDSPAPAYRLGRLFAVLEKVQADATNASTTIRERFYGAASATPVVVFPQLLRKAPHHLAKLDHATFYEKLVQDILSVLQPPRPFPPTLNLEEQGLFALGYYHQRQDLYTKRKDDSDSPTPDQGE